MDDEIVLSDEVKQLIDFIGALSYKLGDNSVQLDYIKIFLRECEPWELREITMFAVDQCTQILVDMG